MPKKAFPIWLDAFTRISVEFFRTRGKIISFVVKLVILKNGTWREVQRYDTYHDCVHMDLIAQDGSKQRMVRFAYLDASGGLSTAIEDFRENHQSYVWRWEHGSAGEKDER